jgi:serine protease Do
MELMIKRISILCTLSALALGGCGLFKKAEPINQTHNGTIQEGDLRLEQDNSLYDDYPIEVEEGWTVNATMVSDAFDTYLILIGPTGDRVSYNDDDASLGGNGTNSKISYTVPSSGTYHLYANAYQAGQSGAYTLTVQAGDSK